MGTKFESALEVFRAARAAERDGLLPLFVDYDSF